MSGNWTFDFLEGRDFYLKNFHKRLFYIDDVTLEFGQRLIWDVFRISSHLSSRGLSHRKAKVSLSENSQNESPKNTWFQPNLTLTFSTPKKKPIQIDHSQTKISQNSEFQKFFSLKHKLYSCDKMNLNYETTEKKNFLYEAIY